MGPPPLTRLCHKAFTMAANVGPARFVVACCKGCLNCDSPVSPVAGSVARKAKSSLPQGDVKLFKNLHFFLWTAPAALPKTPTSRVTNTKHSRRHGRVAQLVEQRIENPRVGGSNPSPATTYPSGEDASAPSGAFFVSGPRFPPQPSFTRKSISARVRRAMRRWGRWTIWISISGPAKGAPSATRRPAARSSWTR